MHIAKYKQHQMYHLLAHYARTHENYSNDSIDNDKTHLNYNLAPDDDFLGKIKKRLQEVSVLKRKDVNYMCDCVVTAPKDLDKSMYSAFFQEVYNFLTNRYGGEKNVISAYVHNDETSSGGLPHIHYSFLPCIKDSKHPGSEKLCAKEVVSRKDLQTLHQDLQAHLDNKNIHCSIITGKTKTIGNKTILELKNESLQRNYDKLTDDYMKLVNSNDELKELIRQQKIARNREERSR